MKSDIIRPRVNELSFHLFNKTLHPEWFDTLAFRFVQREDYSLTIRIIPTGHVLTWRTATSQITEVTATRRQELPKTGSILRHRFHGGEYSDAVKPSQEISYQMCSQVEVLPPEIFAQVHDEILTDATRRGFLHLFYPHNRFALSPLGFVTVEGTRQRTSIATFHTFPDEYAIVKTQSLIER